MDTRIGLSAYLNQVSEAGRHTLIGDDVVSSAEQRLSRPCPCAVTATETRCAGVHPRIFPPEANCSVMRYFYL